MKKTAVLLSLLLLFPAVFLTGLSVRVTVNPYLLSANAVHALVQNDLRGYTRCFGTEVHERLIRQNGHYTAKEREQMLHSLRKTRRRVEENFRLIRSKLQQAGAEMKQLRVFSLGVVDPKVFYSRNHAAINTAQHRPFLVGDIGVVVTDGKRMFGIILDDCVKIGWDWIIGDRVKWRGELKPERKNSGTAVTVAPVR